VGRLRRLVVAVSLSAAALALSAVVAHAADSGVYVVQSGDSLTGIAIKLGVERADLLRVNHLTVTSLIVPGQRLVIPGGASPGPSGSSGASGYMVTAGDTLSGIAARNHVSLASLLAVNHMTATALIVPGQRLVIPGGASHESSGGSGGSAGSGYTVQPGDWLTGIAEKLGVERADLLRVNHLTVTSLIVPGQRLVIPGAAPHESSGGSGASAGSGYAVQPGDWLNGIAEKLGVERADLLRVNHLTVTSLIVPGQRLVIPGAAPHESSRGSGGSAGSGYTVQPGDWLSGIAARSHVSLTSLLAVNHLIATSLIVPGMRLILPAGADGPSAASGGPIDVVLHYALAQLGKPYRFYTAGPASFDCSGLTMAAYARVGIALMHYSAFQAHQGSAVDFLDAPIRPGDLVFMDTDNDGVINHVGMAIDAATWIQAPGPGDVVRLGAIPPESMIAAVRRLVPAT
jgi:LysM repeat protein